jgi:integrase
MLASDFESGATLGATFSFPEGGPMANGSKLTYGSYLTKRPCGFLFRIKIPRSIKPKFRSTELRFSLRTDSVRLARKRAIIFNDYVQRVFEEIESGGYMSQLSDSQIRDLIRGQLQQWLDTDEENRIRGICKGVTVDCYQEEYASLAVMQGKYGVMLANRWYSKNDIPRSIYQQDFSDIEMISATVDQLLAEHGIELDPDSIEYKKMCREFLKAMNPFFEELKQRAMGDYPIQEPKPSHTPAVSEIKKAKPSVNISEGIRRYVADNEMNWTAKSKSEYQTSLQLMIDIIGDISIQSVDREMARGFLENYQKLPKNRNRVVRYRDKTIAQLLALDIPEEDLQAISNIAKNVDRIETFFKYAIQEGHYVGSNPFTDLPMRRGTQYHGDPYSHEELKAVFNSDFYLQDRFRHSYQFWTPMIALFHGMRQNEIAQLYLDDIIKMEDGTWVFDLNANTTDKKLKNQSAKRVVPIHEFLLNDLNLLGVCDRLRKRGAERLFPELRYTGDGYGKNVSKWYNERYRESVGIDKTFHNLRDTFATHLVHKGVPESQFKRVFGHATGQDTLNRHYVGDYAPKRLYDDVISKVSWHQELDLSRLKESRFVAGKQNP